jgi:hypothetical protein
LQRTESGQKDKEEITMKNRGRILLSIVATIVIVAALLAATGPTRAQSGAPTVVSYQGQVMVGGLPYTGVGYFKFAVVNQAGNITYWSNDGTSAGGNPPATPIPLPVSDGLFNGLLGDTSLGGMTQPLSASVFDGTDRYLRVWFSSDGMTFTRLSPDRRIAAVPYALQAKEAKNADTVDGQHASAFAAAGAVWSLTGNADTMPGTHFVGTTDNQALEFRVNNARVLRVEPHATSPNVIGGYGGNSVTGGVYGAVIGGGGASGYTNRVTDAYGTVGGGRGNQAGDGAGAIDDQSYATVGGGADNTASGYMTTIGGGQGNTASGERATVGGGYFNMASGYMATVGGGFSNEASGNRATVGGGTDNIASNSRATVGGGQGNTASTEYTTIGGGFSNGASGYAATIPGGYDNTAAGTMSFAAGRRARANHQGAFVWADSTDADFASGADNQFAVRAGGGVRFETGSAGAEVLGGAGPTSWRVLPGQLDGTDTANAVTLDIPGVAGTLRVWDHLSVANNLTVGGTKSAVVSTADYGQRTLYTVESPANWFEDFGSGQLVDGQAVIVIEPIFAQTVNLTGTYHVYLTPLGDQPTLLFVTQKGATSFTVKGVSLDGVPAACGFDYRIVAKRLGYEDVRLAPAAAPGGGQP